MTNELAIRILTGDVLGTSEQTHEAVTMAVKALSQPDVAEDTISRQVAIDAFKKELTVGESKGNYVTICSAVGYEGAKQILKRLPSAQPDIIRCKDCTYQVESWSGIKYCKLNGYHIGVDDDYCSDARRKTNGIS